jgi:hypothetical protein
MPGADRVRKKFWVRIASRLVPDAGRQRAEVAGNVLASKRQPRRPRHDRKFEVSPGDAVPRGNPSCLRLVARVTRGVDLFRRPGSNRLGSCRRGSYRGRGCRRGGYRRGRYRRGSIRLRLVGLDRLNPLGLRLVIGSEDQAPWLAGLSRSGCQKQSGYQDKSAHVRSPLFDHGKLGHWLDRLCERDHASSKWPDGTGFCGKRQHFEMVPQAGKVARDRQ